MKKKELKGLHQKSKDELLKLLETWDKELVKMRLKAKVGKIKNTSGVKNKRHDIARLKTIIRLKEL